VLRVENGSAISREKKKKKKTCVLQTGQQRTEHSNTNTQDTTQGMHSSHFKNELEFRKFEVLFSIDLPWQRHRRPDLRNLTCNIFWLYVGLVSSEISSGFQFIVVLFFFEFFFTSMVQMVFVFRLCRGVSFSCLA
jgi:hypothetical protein